MKAKKVIITYSYILFLYVERGSVEAQGTDLNVIVRVPVRVIDDDSVSCSQIDTQATSPGGQKEGKLDRTRSWRRTQKVMKPIRQNSDNNTDVV